MIKRLRIWIVKYGESVPFAKGSEGSHYFRSGELTRRLAARGHEVTWWTGRFEHQTKRHLELAENEIRIPGAENSRVVLLNSPGYASNLSPMRFYDHWRIGHSFRRAIQREPVPDVIVASMPTPELARACCDFAGLRKVPIIVDVRDFWPDAIIDRITAKTGMAMPWLLYPYERDVAHVLNAADCVTAISQDCLDWAQRKGRRSSSQKSGDRVFRLASRTIPSMPSRQQAIGAAWLRRGFDPETDRTVFCWAGSLTNQAATRALLRALALLPQSSRDRMLVVICGKGDLESETHSLAEKCDHVIYAGFVPRDEVQFLYDHSHFGLLCYDNTPDFQASFPNKFGEYLMSGLSIVTTVKGAMQHEYDSEGFIVTALPSAELLATTLSSCVDAKPDSALRARARAVFEQDFNADIVYEAFCDHVEFHGAAKESAALTGMG